MPKDTVLIVTAKDEVAIPRVEESLLHMGQPFFRLDTDLLLNNRAQLSLRLHEESLSGELELSDGSSINIESIKSVWFRRPKPISAGGHLCSDLESSQFIEREFSATLFSLYTNLEEVFWMNHPVCSRHVLEHNKLLQLRLAAHSGLATPQTVITNNPAELLTFCEKHGGFIAVKALHSTISRNADGSTAAIYTNRVSSDYLRKKAGNISSAPIIAQEYISKMLELRITVVGNRVLTCAIHSQDSERTKEDWRRYDFDNVKHEQYELPSDIRFKLLDFMKRCGLSFGAIDMIITPVGRYVFLEVNPSGQFGWIEDLTGLLISESIAEALAKCE
jgi:glutathione synthase/RimK-type ligase-like ATP-grasp enzyme